MQAYDYTFKNNAKKNDVRETDIGELDKAYADAFKGEIKK